MRTEFLILIPGEESFCGTAKAFIEFLKIDSLLIFVGNSVSFRKSAKSKAIVSAKYKVDSDKVKASDERYFYVALECSNNELAEEFASMCDHIKSIAERIRPGETAVNTLLDGAGKVFAEKAYPVVYEVENLMRRLIAKFLLVTVGVKWAEDAMLPSLRQKIESFEDEPRHVNDLYKLDFIHLSDMLFEKKRDIGLEELDRILHVTQFSESDQVKILRVLPKSNWDKYFSELVDFSAEKLRDKWRLLYKLRNKVAHNRAVTRADYGMITGLAGEIKRVISAATEKLGEISIDDEDRERIMQTYSPSSGMEFYQVALKAISDFYTIDGGSVHVQSDRAPFDLMVTKGSDIRAVEVKAYRQFMMGHLRHTVQNHQERRVEYQQGQPYSRAVYFCVYQDLGRLLERDHLKERLNDLLESVRDVEIKVATFDEYHNLAVVWEGLSPASM